jgi:hypothetical protein
MLQEMPSGGDLFGVVTVPASRSRRGVACLRDAGLDIAQTVTLEARPRNGAGAA